MSTIRNIGVGGALSAPAITGKIILNANLALRLNINVIEDIDNFTEESIVISQKTLTIDVQLTPLVIDRTTTYEASYCGN